jgi:drug/metabolite transporter (DMT)-like permease
MPSKRHALSPRHFSFLLVAVLWGTTWTAIKVSLQGYPPFVGATLRFVAAIAILTLYARLMRISLTLPRGTARWVVATSMLLYVIDYGLIYWGEQYLNAGVTAILFAVLPLATALVSSFAFRSETLCYRTLAGIVLGLGGTVLVFFDQLATTHFSVSVAWASIAVVVAALAAALSVVIAKRDLMIVPPVPLAIHQMLWGSLGLGIIAVVRGEWQDIHYSLQSTVALLYLGVCGSAAAFVMYYALLRTMAASALSTISYITPLVAVFCSWLLLNESISARVWVGTAAVFAGIAIVQFDYLTAIARSATRPGAIQARLLRTRTGRRPRRINRINYEELSNEP